MFIADARDFEAIMINALMTVVVYGCLTSRKLGQFIHRGLTVWRFSYKTVLGEHWKHCICAESAFNLIWT
jgi:hypothetical protein